MTQEKLSEIYFELLSWLQYAEKPSERIWHPLFYVYPWGLRFELGVYDLDDTGEYVRSAMERGRRIWDAVFAAGDDVLVIFDTTPDTALKQELKNCQLQRIRARRTCPIPGKGMADEVQDFFYRHLYRAAAKDIPFDAILKRVVEEQPIVGGLYRYTSSVYFYNRTKKLLFHPYDDRGADLIGADRESLRPYYRELNELLLNWNREDMDRKWKLRPVHLRILTGNMEPRTEKHIRQALEQIFCENRPAFSDFAPYWKFEGWGELNVTVETTRSLASIRKRFADRWESGCAREGIRLPNVEFLWIDE